MLLIEALVRLLGGVWPLRERCRTARLPWMRRGCALLYHAHMAARGSSISLAATIDGPPVFPHGIQGVFISGEARIGRGCILYQQVTVGSNALPDSRGVGAPVIGEECLLGAGAKIIGNVRVGHRVRVGANSVVTRDVPDDSVVVSGQQTVIRKERLVNRAYTRRGTWGHLTADGFVRETDAGVVERLERAFPPRG